MATSSTAQLPSVGQERERVTAYCARPSCQQEFTRGSGPGRPAAYCSEACRRGAQSEHRRTLARLKHYRQVVDQHERLLAAFDRDLESDHGPAEFDLRAAAQFAVTRAGGAVAFLRGSADQSAVELCALYDAVRPVLADHADSRSG